MFLPEKVFWLRFKGEHGSAAVEMLYSAVTAPGLNSVCSDPTRLMLGVHRGISGHESSGPLSESQKVTHQSLCQIESN
jgi:hypothetical protein